MIREAISREDQEDLRDPIQTLAQQETTEVQVVDPNCWSMAYSRIKDQWKPNIRP